MGVRGSSWVENATGYSSISLGLKNWHPPKKTADLTTCHEMVGEWLLPICPSPHTKAQNTYPLTTRSVTLGLFRNSIWKSNKMFFNTPQKDSSLHSSLIMLCLSEMPPDPAVSQEFRQRQFQGNLSPALVLARSTTPQALSHLDYPPRLLCWVQSSAWPVPPHPETTI